MTKPKVLIIDDDESLRLSLNRALDRQGFEARSVMGCAEAIAVASHFNPDLALIDLRLNDGSGIDLISKLKIKNPSIQCIILTGFGSIEDAVLATQKGAFHFITKPFNLKEVVGLAHKAISHLNLINENHTLKSALNTKYHFDKIIGNSDKIQDVLNLVEKVADTDTTILVTGESGTGKELIAKALHYNSSRANKPFVPINCGAIPSELLESELFGHIKGAFTGAINNRMGRFEMADEGSLFLDEIGDMSAHLQVKLLRVLQERKFEPIGSTKTVESNVRIIAATNINIEKAIQEGRFREDLYYRLNVIPITIPPLRDRKSDIPILLDHFMDKFNTLRNRKVEGISSNALDLLFHYSWPGNIRELENLVERLVILKGQGCIDVDDLPDKYRSRSIKDANPDQLEIPETGMDFNSAIDTYENALILKALEKTGWNRNQAAILLKLNRTTLVEKIKKKGLTPPPQMTV
ncbi:MAG: sigma-54-dependent Fis family transcriptional regulator [Bdellovibrionaceae bacterium]|jgi:DNA-binding NtrC family response regulator|nr:sigma-54-dependent Fis family transcriptional regulator [Pseudobdellovibrionaceae bacterium]